MKKIESPEVYVGTWRKYNRGSIAGKWVKLAKFSTYEDFVKECYRIHRDESDPEFMIQDFCGFPNGLGCGECLLTKKEFNDIMDAWREENAPKQADRTKTNPYAQCLQEYIDTLTDDEDKKYYQKYYIAAVKVGDNYCLIKRDSIENAFCFSDEGPEYEFYKSLTSNQKKIEDYFVRRNLRKYGEVIDALKRDEMFAIFPMSKNRCEVIPVCSWRRYDEGLEMATEDLKEELICAYQYAMDEKYKRVAAYLKRYGTSKIRMWSYWANA